MSSKKTDASRARLVQETIETFVALVLTQKFADMPKWVEQGLTVSQLRAIYFLAFRGAMTISELARSLDLGNPAASILVQQLVEREFAERSEDKADRRRAFVRLTARGAELVSGRREQREAKFRRWLAQLDNAELSCLRRGVTALLEVILSDQNKPSDAVKR